jgi:AcrR family transcriptional regulator
MTIEPKTRRGRETRERIVERAAELVAAHGVEQTSLDDVLAAASASKSQLYHYFADRDALVEAAVERRLEQLCHELARAFATVQSLAELEQRLEGFIVVYQQTLAGCPIGTLANEVAERHDGARRQVENAFGVWEALFTGVFERMRERGELRPDADPTALATTLLAALQGGQLLSQIRRDATSLRVAVAGALGYVRTFAT